MDHDVIIIGGSYAGMAAALQLVRARRKVLVIDAGKRRNRFTSYSHGFLGQDGIPPSEIAEDARAQLETYPTLSWIENEAVSLNGVRDTFEIGLKGGQVTKGKRVLMATGVRDELPDIDGIKDRWGKTIFHCPYCHGYELNQGRIGVIGTGHMSLHQTELLTEWGDVTFFANKTVEIAPEMRSALEARNVSIIEEEIIEVTGKADIGLADNQTASFDGLFIATEVSPASSLPAQIGVTMQDTPIGKIIDTDGAKETSVPGIYACGDLASAPHSVSLAVGDGAIAGLNIHRSLVWPDA